MHTMKLNKYTIGAIAGITSLAIAIPIIAEVSSAATPATTSSNAPSFTRPIPTQQQVSDMAAKDGAFLKNVDAIVTVEKTATQAHEAALTAAASITDDTQRQAAVQKANQDERTAIQSAITANPDLKSAMMPLGGGRGEGFGDRGGFGQGSDLTALATKLGITADQLKTEMQSGKTVQQIATEHGVTLPVHSEKHGGWMGHGPFGGNTATSSTPAAQ